MLVLAGCGTTTVVKTVTVASSTQTVTVIKHARPPKPRTATVTNTVTAPQPTSTGSSPTAASGNTVQDFSGNTLTAAANGLVDPASPVDPAVGGPSAGTRLLAVQLSLKNDGPGTISSDANNNATVLGSDGQAYTASFSNVSECTNFSHGTYTILPGNSEQGCVVFAIPDGVNVKAVQFSLGNGMVQFNNR